jgi:16S rRNA (guanine966-N2)-methyltransferase
MKLRIVAGTLGRRMIAVEKRAQGFRPTQERVRQAVAETLKPRIPGARAADLCAGSGAMGIELVSRGAASVDFVENDRARALCIERHCAAFGIGERCRIAVRNVASFLDARDAPYDIIFYDPPYGDAALAALVPNLCALLSSGGVLVYERDRSAAPAARAGFETRTRGYGDTEVDFVTRAPGPQIDTSG